jgi:hypothetical protein
VRKRATSEWGLVRKQIFAAQDGDVLFDDGQHTNQNWQTKIDKPKFAFNFCAGSNKPGRDYGTASVPIAAGICTPGNIVALQKV